MLAKLDLAHAQKDTKCSFPLGPYPRYTWIHDDTPEDGLDKACYEIWKRVQQLSAQLDPSPKEAKEPEPNQCEVDFEAEEPGESLKGKLEEKAPDSCGKDDVSLLVQLEYLSIMGENASIELHQSNSEENCQVAASGLEQAAKKEKEPQGSGVEPLEKDNFLSSILKSVCGTEQMPKNGNFAKEEATELNPTKGSSKDVLQLEPNADGSVASNKEICQLLAQFSLKHINESEAPDNKVVMEEAQIIKDFLQNNMFSSADDKKLEPSPPAAPSGGESQDEQSRRQLPVFAKLCEEPAPASKLESRRLALAPGAFEHREEFSAAATGLPTASGTRAREILDAGNDLVELLCAGQKEAFPKEPPEGQESPRTGSPEPREKAQSGSSNKSEHSYSTSRHALKGTAPSARKGTRLAKEAGKARDLSGGQAAIKHKEDFNSAKCGEGGKEAGHKMAVFVLNEDAAKMASAKRDGLPLEKPDMQDAEPVPGHSSSDSAGSECTAGSTDEDNVCGALKDGDGRCAGSLFSSSQAEAEPSGLEDASVSYQNKNAAGASLQLPGAAYDSGAKYGATVYPARFPSGTLPMPSRPPLINYPPVPPAPTAAPSTPGYAQHQPFYQPRTMRLPHQQAAYQQAGCFVQPANPYNYRQMAQEYVPRQAYIRATYAPLVGYWSFVPEYSYSARNPPKPLTPVSGSNNPPPMAGDGPQCLFQPAYGYLDSNMTATRFSSGRTGPMYNNSNFQMYYSADGSGYNYW